MVTPPLNPIRVGGEVDAACSKCELNLAHTILAMVDTKIIRVRCNTCNSDHVFRGTQPLAKPLSFAAPKKSASTAKRAEKPAVTRLSWDDQLKDKDVARARKYSPRDTYKVDDVVDHPSFGLGFVTAVRGEKVDLSFKTFEKTLVHGRPAPAEPAQ